MTNYQCEECGESFPKLSQLLQHRRLQNHWKKYMCPSCKKVFNRKQNLDRHMKKHSDDNNQHCPECLKVFTREDALEDHLHQEHGWEAPKRQGEDQEGGGAAKRQHTQPQDADGMYSMEKINERKIEKFRTMAAYYKIYMNDMDVRELPKIMKVLKQIFQSIIDKIAGHIQSMDLVRVTMDNPQLDFPIVLPFMRRSDLTVDRLLAEIERVLQSYEQFVLDETFGMELVHVNSVSGTGYNMKPCVDLTSMLERKKSIIQIRNKDQLCCARALVTAIARIEHHPQWNSIRLGRGVQKQLALNLHEQAGVPLGPCGIEEVKTFQAHLLNYQIHVLSKEHFNAIVYQGPEGGVPIYLYSHDGHYDVITTMTGFLGRSYFCDQCKKGYQHKERHTCNNPCHFCRQLHENKEEDWQFCQTCNRKFLNPDCLMQHMKKTEQGKSTCDTIYRCTQCNQLINRSKHKRQHVCGETYCKTCKEYVGEGHQCFMQPVDVEGPKKAEKQTQYIFFDFECTQDSQLECENGYNPGVNAQCVNCRKSWCGSMAHTPNLCVAHKVCNRCMADDVQLSPCSKCGTNKHVFKGPNTTAAFCKWLFSDENRGATVMCHNFKGYDSYPILKYLHDNAVLPEVITTGSKYMSICVPACKIRMIDSLNFIPMPLAEMPESFGEKELAKGYFPHLYNRQENQQTILDRLPDIQYYNPDSMKPDTRKKFLQWFEENKNSHFNFQEELLRYCESDVDILRKCVLKFRQLFMSLTKTDTTDGIDPFDKCITIASACNLVFRTIFLDHESIGIIPPHGYRAKAKQSVMAYQWMSYLAHAKGVHIQHGRNTGEKEIGPYMVDGYYETTEGEQIVLEFHGDFWHGCPRCFGQTTTNPVCDITMGELYAQTLEKQRYIEAQGYTYMCMWECDFKRQLAKNADMKTYINALDFALPLEPRDAFYGGRTEAFTLYDEASESKTIKYFDVTSLYPWVNKTGKIPMGHPNIITDNFKDIAEYEGLVKCKVLAPRQLYMPVLPTKCNGKLLFSLCRTCGETYQQSPCEHTDEERALMGTWVTDEIKEAIAQGYRIVRIYEVWHFEEVSRYDSGTKSGGLFTGYINTFLKVKQESSGWPAWCVTEEDRQTYIQQYNDTEGIQLNYHNIKKNPGLRSLAKLMLNSFWGKMGQRSNLTRTTYIEDPKQFMDMMTSDQQQVKNVRFVNDEVVQLDWVHGDDFIEPSCRTNVVIAAYTTAQARLKLYSYLRPLCERVLYCDTDSVVFVSQPGEWEPPLGDFLGDLTDETPNNSILKFVTGGPKNYAYTIEKPNKKGQTSICKVRGITLNFKNQLDINFNTIRELVTGDRKGETISVLDNNKIARNPTTGHVITKTETKDYKIVFDKRVIRDTIRTYPYGL